MTLSRAIQWCQFTLVSW